MLKRLDRHQKNRFKYLIFCLFLPILFVTSCTKSAMEVEATSLYGTWIENNWDEGIQELVKSSVLDTHKYGFIIKPNGRFIEYANSGDCATPPISYTKYEGRWKAISADSLHIDVGYWNGQISYDIKIISVDLKKLQIKRVY